MPTRFYFPSSTAADVSPATNGTWQYKSEAVNRKLERTKTSTAMANGSQIGPWTAGQSALDRCYVSAPLAAQTISGTVKCQIRCREHANADNSTSRLEIYVVSNDGATVRGTLLAVGQYGPATELVNSATLRNKSFADGDTMSSVAINDGDRLVVCIGYSDAFGTTPEATARYGDTGTTDLSENETETTDNVPWIEFSGTIDEQAPPIEVSGTPSLALTAAGEADVIIAASGTPSLALTAAGEADVIITAQASAGGGSAPPTDCTANYDASDAGGYTLAGSDVTAIHDLTGDRDFDIAPVDYPERTTAPSGDAGFRFFAWDPGAPTLKRYLRTTEGPDGVLGASGFTVIVEFEPNALPLVDETNTNPDNGPAIWYVNAASGQASLQVRENDGGIEVGAGGFGSGYSDARVWEASTLDRQIASFSYNPTTNETRLRVNKGAAVTQTTALIGEPFTDASGYMQLGQSDPGGIGMFDGWVFRVSIFDRVLSDEEIDATVDEWNGVGGAGPTLQLTAAGTLDSAVLANGAPTLSLTASGDLDVVVDAEGAPSLALTAAGSAQTLVTAQGAPSLALTASGDLDVVVDAEGTPSLALTAAGSAQTLVTAQGTPSLALTASGDLDVVVDAEGAPSLALTAAGSAQTLVTAQGAPSLALTAAGTAQTLVTAQGAPSLALTAAGTAELVSGAIEAAGAPSLVLTAAGDLDVVVDAEGTPSLALTAAGTAQTLVTAQGAPSLALTAAGSAQTLVTAQGAASLALTAAATAQTLVTAQGAPSLALTAAGTAELASDTIETSGAPSLVLTASGDLDVVVDAAGAGALSLAASGDLDAVVDAEGMPSLTFTAAGSAQTLVTAQGAGSLALAAAGSAVGTTSHAVVLVVPARGSRTLLAHTGPRTLTVAGRRLVLEVRR